MSADDAPETLPPPGPGSTRPLATPADAEVPLLEGLRYENARAINRGGMGVILQAHDPTVGREVAVKVMLDDGPELAARFLAEARVTGQLTHPNIVPVHEVATTPGGTPYYTMKLVRGRSLDEVLDLLWSGHERAAWPLSRLLDVFAKVCDAVAFAHARGVVHRDLKPSNVMIGEFGEVQVMDWGLAKVLSAPASTDDTPRRPSRPDPLATQDGVVVGTPGYMAPEQAAGQIDAIDARTDVYGLGAILYAILTLQAPYDEGDGLLTIDAVRAGPPPTPSARAPDRDVPWELEAVVERAMARFAPSRYPTATALREDIDEYLAGRVLTAARYTPWQRALKHVRRHGRSLGAAAVALLSLLISLAFYGVSQRRHAAALEVERNAARDAAGEADRARQRAERERRRADGQRAAAQANLADARLMADLHRLRGLLARTDGLWLTRPTGDGGLVGRPTAERVVALRREIAAWADEVGQLVARRAVYEAARARAAVARTAAPDDYWQQRRHAVFGQLVEACARATETIDAVLARLRYTRRFVIGPDAAAWNAAARRVADNPRYAGLRLTSQLGLIPLGPGPEGYEEFAHHGSGTPPRRGSDGRLRLDARSAIVLVLLPAGRYTIGAQPRRTGEPTAPYRDPGARAHDGPPHPVQLDAFLIAKTELTQWQWAQLEPRSNNPSRFQPGRSAYPVTLRHPVESINWEDAVRVLGRLGLQLPTEAQWEAAARGGRGTTWFCGDDAAALAARANLADRRLAQVLAGSRHDDVDDGHAIHAPVASYPRGRNGFGLYDVAGNVMEWCRDVFDEKAYGRPADRAGVREGIPPGPWRVVRGGSWTSPALGATSARRLHVDGRLGRAAVGVRAVRQLTVPR